MAKIKVEIDFVDVWNNMLDIDKEKFADSHCDEVFLSLYNKHDFIIDKLDWVGNEPLADYLRKHGYKVTKK